jgi:MOSC domain-containing protein
VTTFDAELRDALALILGSQPPPAEGEALPFFGQWLAERNLGLVPIADPRTFSWPGHWIARVHTASTEHAVVMFGSPSGPVHDPHKALAGGGEVIEGWLVARLDVHLPIDQPYGSTRASGSVAGILVAADAEAPMVRVDEASALKGRGLEGDRYCDGNGTFSKPGRGYQLTLVDADVLQDVGLAWEDGRRNIVTRGIDLNALVGRRFMIGGIECIGRRLAEPCAHLEKLSRPGILRPLVHRGGLRADIVADGTVRVGDAVTPRS